MKKSIEMPIVNVIRYEAKDVITTSGESTTVPTTPIIPGGQPGGPTGPSITAGNGGGIDFAESKSFSVDPGRLVW